jgi:hypothetical protein
MRCRSIDLHTLETIYSESHQLTSKIKALYRGLNRLHNYELLSNNAPHFSMFCLPTGRKHSSFNSFHDWWG